MHYITAIPGRWCQGALPGRGVQPGALRVGLVEPRVGVLQVYLLRLGVQVAVVNVIITIITIIMGTRTIIQEVLRPKHKDIIIRPSQLQAMFYLNMLVMRSLSLPSWF